MCVFIPVSNITCTRNPEIAYFCPISCRVCDVHDVESTATPAPVVTTGTPANTTNGTTLVSTTLSTTMGVTTTPLPPPPPLRPLTFQSYDVLQSANPRMHAAISQENVNFSNGVYEQVFATFPGWQWTSEKRNLTAQIGPVTQQISIDQPLPTATHVVGEVIDTHCSLTSPYVRVAVRAWADVISSATSAALAYASVRQGDRVLTSHCHLHPIHGACIVRFEIPHLWIHTGDPMDISVGLSDDSLVLLEPRVYPYTDNEWEFANDIVAVIPNDRINANETFTVSVHSRTDFPIESVQFAIVLDNDREMHVEFLASSYNSTLWTRLVQTTASGHVLVTLMKQSVRAAPHQPSTHLIDLTLRVDLPVAVTVFAAAAEVRVYEFYAPNSLLHFPAVYTSDTRFVRGYVTLPSAHGATSALLRQLNLTVQGAAPTFSLATPRNGQHTMLSLGLLTGESTSTTIDLYSVMSSVATLQPEAIVQCETATASSYVATTIAAGACAVVFDRAMTGVGRVVVQVAGVHGGSATVSFTLWLPDVPVAMQVSAPVLRPITIGARGQYLKSPIDNCTTVYTSSALQVWATFSTTADTAPRSKAYDITSIVAPLLHVNDSAVARVDAATAQIHGLRAGTVRVTLGTGTAGSVVLVVDASSNAYIDQLNLMAFSGLDMSYTTTRVPPGETILSTRLQVLMGNMTRLGPEGAFYVASAVTLKTSTSDVLTYSTAHLDFPVAYFVSDDNVVSINQSSNTITAQQSGTIMLTAIVHLNDGCGFPIPYAALPTMLSVLPEAPVEAYFVDANGSRITSVSIRAPRMDTAALMDFLPPEAVVAVHVVYATYVAVLTLDPGTDYAIFNNTAAIEVLVRQCTGTQHMCIGTDGVGHGQWTVQATFIHAAVTAHLDMELVQLESLEVQLVPYPIWEDVSLLNKTIAYRIGPTVMFQQFALLARVFTTQGQALHVREPRALNVTTASAIPASNATVANDNNTSVITLWDADVFTVHAAYGDLVSTSHTIVAVENSTQIVNISRLRLVNASSNTVYAPKDTAAAATIDFDVDFDDGTRMTRADLVRTFNHTLLARLITFSSTDNSVLTIDAVSGRMVVRANARGSPVGIRVAAADSPNISSTIDVFTNLKAIPIDVNFAAQRDLLGVRNGFPLVQTGDEVRVLVYISSGIHSVASVALDVQYDPSLLEFLSVHSGGYPDAMGDDSGWQDALVGGEPSAGNASLVRVAGVSGRAMHTSDDWVLASLAFRAVAPGTAFFAGEVVEMTDIHGQPLLSAHQQIVAGHGKYITIGGASTSHAARARRHITTRARRTDAEAGCVPGAGPFPLGDVDRDCALTIRDVLSTATYLSARAAAAPEALDGFANLSVDAMNADGCGVVDHRDVLLLFHSYLGRVHLVGVPQLTMMPDAIGTGGVGACMFELSVAVSQVPREATPTPPRIFFVVTGPSALAASLDAITWQNGREYHTKSTMAAPGRSLGYIEATPQNGSNVYSVLGSGTIPQAFGISVVQIMQSSDGHWEIPREFQHMTTGCEPDPQENVNATIFMGFPVGNSSVPFVYSTPFAPLFEYTHGVVGPCQVGYSTTTTTASTTTASTTTPTAFTTTSTKTETSMLVTSTTTMPATTALPTASIAARPTTARCFCSSTAVSPVCQQSSRTTYNNVCDAWCAGVFDAIPGPCASTTAAATATGTPPTSIVTAHSSTDTSATVTTDNNRLGEFDLESSNGSKEDTSAMSTTNIALLGLFIIILVVIFGFLELKRQKVSREHYRTMQVMLQSKQNETHQPHREPVRVVTDRRRPSEPSRFGDDEWEMASPGNLSFKAPWETGSPHHARLSHQRAMWIPTPSESIHESVHSRARSHAGSSVPVEDSSDFYMAVQMLSPQSHVPLSPRTGGYLHELDLAWEAETNQSFSDAGRERTGGHAARGTRATNSNNGRHHSASSLQHQRTLSPTYQQISADDAGRDLAALNRRISRGEHASDGFAPFPEAVSSARRRDDRDGDNNVHAQLFALKAQMARQQGSVASTEMTSSEPDYDLSSHVLNASRLSEQSISKRSKVLLNEADYALSMATESKTDSSYAVSKKPNPTSRLESKSDSTYSIVNKPTGRLQSLAEDDGDMYLETGDLDHGKLVEKRYSAASSRLHARESDYEFATNKTLPVTTANQSAANSRLDHQRESDYDLASDAELQGNGDVTSDSGDSDDHNAIHLLSSMMASPEQFLGKDPEDDSAETRGHVYEKLPNAEIDSEEDE